MTDPALRFWLRHVEASGGLCEQTGDVALVVLPPDLAKRYQLDEEVVVTGDPDVAREDGVTFLGAGHPVLTEAAESVLENADVGVRLLDRPAAAPAGEVLLDHARQQLPVGHGRVDLAGPSNLVVRTVLRVGALVTYTVSAEDQYAEQIEQWVDVPACRVLPTAVADRLARAPAVRPADGVAAGGIVPALVEAHRVVDESAARRCAALSAQLGDAPERERQRTLAYYADVVAGIERRMAGAAPDRQALLAERLAATREEEARRLAETAERYRPRHAIRPYRLHVIGVPAVRLPVDVRRGDRRYPMTLDWLVPAGVFAQPRCPACGSVAPLSAGKSGLGCLACHTPKAPPPVPRPAPPRQRQPSPPPSPPRSSPPPAAAVAKPGVVAEPASASMPATVAAAAPRRRPAKLGDDLAVAFWKALGAGRARRLRALLAPRSPAAAIERTYGVEGLLRAAGVQRGDLPHALSTQSQVVDGGYGLTTAVAQTDAGDRPHAIVWRTETAWDSGRVAEVLPVTVLPDLRFGMWYWWAGVDTGLRVDRMPATGARLDEAAKAVVAEGLPWHGLAVVARALAAWDRLADRHADLLAEHPPAALGAAVHRLVALRAGDKGHFREVAGAYRVAEDAVRRADARLRKLLALGPTRAW